MNDQDKTKEQLVADLAELRRQVAVWDDIDRERRLAEEELRSRLTLLQQAHGDLERQIEARTAELAKANEDLAVFQRFSESSDDGFGMSEFDGRIVYANQGLCRLFGEQGPEDVIGKNVSTYYPEDYVRRRTTEMLPALLHDGRWHIEQTVLPHRGPPIQVWQSTFLIRDEKGDPWRIAVVIRDITAQKKAEQALAESEAKYRHLVETTDTGYLILDEKGRVVDANPEYVRITGRSTLAEIIGQSVLEWTAAQDMGRNGNEIDLCIQGGVVRQLEVAYLQPGGQIVPVEINACCIETQQGKRILSLCRDITERKRAEQALRQSHDELRVIYDNLMDGLLIAEVETKRLVRANAAICRMLGYTEAELLSMSVKDIHAPDALPGVLARFHSQVPRRQYVTSDTRVVRKDGSMFPVDIAACMLEYNGRPCRVGIFRDVSERKQAQEAREKEHRALRHLLQSSDHERQLIAYEIHDGLAQQLAGAIMQLQAFEHLQDTKPQEAREAFDAGLIMLRQSHMEARRLITGVRPPILDEQGVVAAVAHLVNEERSKKGPEISFQAKVEFDRLTPILENAIYRITQEALTNACRHSHAEKIHVELVQCGDHIRIEVRDRGVGFTLEDVGESRFGLAGIKERAKLLGGVVQIDAAPDRGTQLIVELPLVPRRPDDN